MGSVINTEQAILPAAVGVGIGCGMIAALTDWRLKDLENPGLRGALHHPAGTQ